MCPTLSIQSRRQQWAWIYPGFSGCVAECRLYPRCAHHCNRLFPFPGNTSFLHQLRKDCMAEDLACIHATKPKGFPMQSGFTATRRSCSAVRPTAAHRAIGKRNLRAKLASGDSEEQQKIRSVQQAVGKNRPGASRNRSSSPGRRLQRNRFRHGQHRTRVRVACTPGNLVSLSRCRRANPGQHSSSHPTCLRKEQCRTVITLASRQLSSKRD